MLAEILGLPDAVEFVEAEYEGHYVRTPYAFQPKLGRKYVTRIFCGHQWIGTHRTAEYGMNIFSWKINAPTSANHQRADHLVIIP